MNIIRFNNKGWRARFDDGFNAYNLSRIADAFGYIWADAAPGTTIYVGYDTRYNGRGLAGVVAGVLASHGLRIVVSEAACPTPALGWNIMRDPDASGGVMLTASSASCEYGGISVRAADGGPISGDFYDAAAKIVSSTPVSDRAPYELRDFVSPYINHLKGLVDAEAIEKAHINVVVDSLYGSSRVVLAQLLRSLGCRVHEIHNEENPDFGGLHPTPTEPWVDTLEQAVLTYGSDLGLALDGDGDRIGVIDASGNYVTPHKTVPIVMDHLVNNKGLFGRVVVTYSSSAYVRRQANRLGCEFTVVPMGFVRIYDEFVEGDVLLGADEFGGICVPSHLPERDGLLSALLIVECMAVRALSMADLVNELVQNLGTMHYIRRDIRLDVASIQSFRNILPGLYLRDVCGMDPVEVGHSDGLVMRFSDDSWVQLRPSRTEALIRACAEAPDVQTAHHLAEEACKGALKQLPR
ncbi:MAG: phosphoglucomutase [Atopobiaceae bacterium]|jgi:phosphomannomutase|nr:phosphoglucomutase [Atopobiaceae bacterium]